MSRRDGINIAEIIDQCKEFKDNYNNFKKLSSPLEEQIKEYALTHPNEKLVSDKWEANVKITQKEGLDEEKAISIIKENLSGRLDLLTTVIKTKEYIDDEALEKLIYNNEFDINLLSSCKTLGEPSVRLTIGKRKDK